MTLCTEQKRTCTYTQRPIVWYFFSWKVNPHLLQKLIRPSMTKIIHKSEGHKNQKITKIHTECTVDV